mgnify:CR=1 FL=1
MYRSGNPALRDSTFEKSSYKDTNWWEVSESNMMTIEGVAEKTGLLLLLTATTALAVIFTMPGSAPLAFVGFVGSIVVLLMVIFSGSTNPSLICAYAAFEGLFLGGITWLFEVGLELPGIGLLAALLTFMILGGMLSIYRAGLIHWDRNLAIAVSSAVFAIILVYLISIIGVFVGFEVPYIHGSGPIGILFSLFVVAIGALCLVADFDFIERGVLRGAPKQLEWRAAFGLMVTLVWLYLEILKLLAKLASRR